MGRMAEDDDNLVSATKAAIRKEAIQQSAKWVIGGAVALAGFAAIGWWFYFKPLVIDTLGGVPRGAVMAFDRDDLTEDHCPVGWVPFLEARAHVIVGAGDPAKSPGKMAYDERGNKLQGYVLVDSRHTSTSKRYRARPAQDHIATSSPTSLCIIARKIK